MAIYKDTILLINENCKFCKVSSKCRKKNLTSININELHKAPNICHCKRVFNNKSVSTFLERKMLGTTINSLRAVNKTDRRSQYWNYHTLIKCAELLNSILSFTVRYSFTGCK